MATAVEFEGVCKRFLLRHERPRSFQELMLNMLKGNRDTAEEFWALKDVSFKVQAGETLGIIGPNGAGKSTILKLIARILEPTSGRITVNGRVSALLELGAGFHPDLTGRENIFLNGSLLGLSRKEMMSKFDQIVKFAELEHFVDVPVRHYSSGMLIRLGFSIATSVEADVLLVDEVLAVGDEHFQRKCLERMGEIHRKGTTILFVSHSLETMQNVCSNAIWLDRGVVRARGMPKEVVDHYLRGIAAGEQLGQEGFGTLEAEIVKIEMLDENDQTTKSVYSGENVTFRMEVAFHADAEGPLFGFVLRREDGLNMYDVYDTDSRRQGMNSESFEAGEKVVVEFKVRLNLLRGRYSFIPAVAYSDGIRFFHWRENALFFDILDDGTAGGIVGLDTDILIAREDLKGSSARGRGRK